MKRNESSSEEKAVIIKEALRWVHENKGTCVTKGGYASPRVSSEIMDCSMPMTFDQYNFCSLGCLYCFAYFFKSNNPAITDLQLRSVNADRLIASMKGEGKKPSNMYRHFFKRRFLFHWGGLADPFCAFEKTNSEGYKIIKYLAKDNYPTLFSFKGSTVLEPKYLEIWKKYRKQRNFAFQVSIITSDNDLAKKVEVGVQSPDERLHAMKVLSDLGYWTILRLRPFIIGITDPTLEDLLEKAKNAGAKGISTEFFAMDGRCNDGMRTRYDYLAKQMGLKDAKELQKHYHKLSPSERGGYMRLNRNVKEPYIKTLYKFCVENDMVLGISDPDFKELNMTGSCCAMPDDYPPNRGLQNWTRNQLTYHLKEARRNWHKTGERQFLYFSKVYDDESYFDDPAISQDHVSVIGRCNAERKLITYRGIIQEHWNNLRSYANPRNYFHGKIMPCGVDKNGNMIYEYIESDYERRWKKEGIDLTK